MGNRGSSHPIIPPEDIAHIKEFGFTVDKKQLGEGMQGRVFRAQLRKPIEFFGDQKTFAIKMMNLKERMDMCSNNAMITHRLVEMIEKEKSIMSDIDHRNVVSIQLCLSLGEFRTVMIGEKCVIVHDRVYMFMALAEQSLFDFLYKGREDKKLSENVAKSLCRQLTEGLQYLHSKRIIHGDIHLANVLMFTDKQTKQNIPKWADYGMAQKNVTDSALFADDITQFGTYVFESIVKSTKFDSKDSETSAKELSRRMAPSQRISLEEVLNHDWLK